VYKISNSTTGRHNEAKIHELETSVHRCSIARRVGAALFLLGWLGMLSAIGGVSLVIVLAGLCAVVAGFILGLAGVTGEQIAREALNIERARQDPKCTNIVISENWLGRKVTYVYEP
jgi:hypothetical protein